MLSPQILSLRSKGDLPAARPRRGDGIETARASETLAGRSHAHACGRPCAAHREPAAAQERDASGGETAAARGNAASVDRRGTARDILDTTTRGGAAAPDV